MTGGKLPGAIFGFDAYDRVKKNKGKAARVLAVAYSCMEMGHLKMQHFLWHNSCLYDCLTPYNYTKYEEYQIIRQIPHKHFRKKI